MIRNKTIKFNLEKQDDRELWEYLRSLEHGDFSDITKNFWRTRMSHDKTSKREERIQDLINVARRNGYKGESPL